MKTMSLKKGGPERKILGQSKTLAVSVEALGVTSICYLVLTVVETLSGDFKWNSRCPSATCR